MSTDPRPAQLANLGFPVVTIGRPVGTNSVVSTVYADENLVVEQVLTHLWSLGHRRIAHLVGPVGTHSEYDSPLIEPSSIAVTRLQAYENWMKRSGLFEPDLIQHAYSWSAEYAERPTRLLLGMKNRPTAVFCANDSLALRVIQIAQSVGLRIPEDLSIVGVDNSAYSMNSQPNLTTVDVDVHAMGKQAVITLTSLIDAETSCSIQNMLSQSRLVVRNSTAPPPEM